MNKKLNTVLFVIGATLVNMVMILLFLAGFLLYGAFLAPRLPPEVNSIALLLLFIGSIIGTYFLYHRIMRFLSNKVNWDKYFSPLFGRGSSRPKDQ
ncbi:MAG: hypothetical protein N2442_01685 [Spirochaetes bacterium]|nr:hypothetical protein [Spirochaetota bacterium]